MLNMGILWQLSAYECGHFCILYLPNKVPEYPLMYATTTQFIISQVVYRQPRFKIADADHGEMPKFVQTCE